MSTADGENTTGVTSRIRHPSLIVKRHSQAWYLYHADTNRLYGQVQGFSHFLQ
jgi:hypothetical protein